VKLTEPKPIKEVKKEKVSKPKAVEKKRVVNKKPAKKSPAKKNKKPSKQESISLAPVFEAPVPLAHIFEQRRMNIIETPDFANSSKKTIRRSGLEIKKAEELMEKKKIEQEKEWEIPAFLRRVKYKN
jgi:hypothetical protein